MTSQTDDDLYRQVLEESLDSAWEIFWAHFGKAIAAKVEKMSTVVIEDVAFDTYLALRKGQWNKKRPLRNYVLTIAYHEACHQMKTASKPHETLLPPSKLEDRIGLPVGSTATWDDPNEATVEWWPEACAVAGVSDSSAVVVYERVGRELDPQNVADMHNLKLSSVYSLLSNDMSKLHEHREEIWIIRQQEL